MKRINNKKNLYKSMILLIILIIGIGYAYLTSNLSISGQTEVVSNTWNIHFENLNISTGSVTASTPATIDSNSVDITYSISLSRPKDYYEFTVDIKNDGTLPGKVSISSLSGLDTTSSKVIDYSISYTNGNSVNVGDILNAGAKKSIKVRVYYKDDISESDFPATDLNLTLTYTLQYVQSEEDETLNVIVRDLVANNSSCFIKYEGEVTDRVGETVTASNVYFNKCIEKRNIIFNNMCWQMIRTTETGGIKVIYNGDVVDGKCESTRGDHKGIVQSNNNNQSLSSSYLYGSSFTYDNSTNEFTLLDTTTATWSDSTYGDLLGKYTCKNATGTCTTVYNVNGYINSTTAYTSAYVIDDTNYDQIGTSSFNAYYRSPAMVGYMFNKVYMWKDGSPVYGSLMGNDVAYNNGEYTLLPSPVESELGTSRDSTHHYTCNNTTGICSKVIFYFHDQYNIQLDGEMNIQEAVNKMLYDDDVNRYDSSIKGITDAWFAQNISSKTNKLEDAVFCNSRSVTNSSTNGWNNNGGQTTQMEFKNYTQNEKNLSCVNEIDQFAVGNNKAKLTYPVGLLQNEELSNISSSSLGGVHRYWTMSPSRSMAIYAFARYFTNTGYSSDDHISAIKGDRPIISLKDSLAISSGTGTETDPWIVE